MIELNEIQQKAYARFIKARDRVGLGAVKPNKNYSWVPLSDYSACVDVAGMNHPLFVQNDEWLEYKEAFSAWLAVEPECRDRERMRMSRGDYGTQDSWEERGNKVTDIVNKIKEEK
jgi:hypothetical protein